MQAGGHFVVKEEAVNFMDNTLQSSPPQSEWPPSLQKLGNWMRIEHDNQLVIVGIGKMFNMADEFGFIIQKEGNYEPKPHYFGQTEYVKLWELEDGIYLFQRP